MEEVRGKRSLNAKHFLRDDGSFQMDAHVGHIHYVDKIGGTGIRSIDWTLSFDIKKKGWSFAYHSFRPFIPKFADDWVEFRDLFGGKDQTIRYRAHAAHVVGRLVMPSDIGIEDLSQQNCIIYEHAFGEGLDYIIYFTRSSMKKVVRIRDGFKSTSDMKFTWDIDLPSAKKVFRSFSKEDIGTARAYELNMQTSKAFDTKKQTLIGDDLKDGKEWFTYLRDFKCWDSGKLESYHEQGIVVEYDAAKKTITKIIPAAFLALSSGAVFSDTTTSYYPGAGDGTISDHEADQNSITTAQTAPTGLVAYPTADGTGIQSYGIGAYASHFDMWRAFFPVDTSSIGSGSTVSSAALYVKPNYIYNAGVSYSYGAVVQTAQASTSTLVANTTDWGSIGTKGSNDVTYGSMTVGSYSAFTLNATGLGWINVSGYSKLGIHCGHDFSSQNPTTYDQVFVYYSEYTGTGSDPYISITYTTGDTIVTPSALTVTSSIPAYTVIPQTVVAPSEKNSVWSSPGVTVNFGAVIARSAQTATFSIPAYSILTLDVQVNITVVTTTASIPTYTVITNTIVSPSTPSAVWSAPSYLVKFDINIAIDQQSLLFTLSHPQDIGGIWTRAVRSTSSTWSRSPRH